MHPCAPRTAGLAAERERCRRYPRPGLYPCMSTQHVPWRSIGNGARGSSSDWKCSNSWRSDVPWMRWRAHRRFHAAKRRLPSSTLESALLQKGDLKLGDVQSRKPIAAFRESGGVPRRPIQVQVKEPAVANVELDPHDELASPPRPNCRSTQARFRMAYHTSLSQRRMKLRLVTQ